MEKIDWSNDQPLLKAELLGVVPVLLCVLTRDRNAWHGTRSRVYDGPHGLTNSAVDAKVLAESRRQRGSAWIVTEVPGIALLNEVAPVAIAEFHSRNCFGRWDHEVGKRHLLLGTSMGEAMHAFGVDGHWRSPSPSKHSIIMGKGERGLFAPLSSGRPLHRWASVARGGNQPLGWAKTESYRYIRGGTAQVRQTFETVNDADAIAAARERYWRARANT